MSLSVSAISSPCRFATISGQHLLTADTGRIYVIVLRSLWTLVSSEKTLAGKVIRGVAVFSFPFFLTAVARLLVSCGAIFHLVSFPLTVRSWSALAMYLHFRSGINELKSLAISIYIYPILASSLEPRNRISIQAIPIVMVHGYMHNSSAWLFMRQYLLEMGLGPIFTPNLGSPFQSIEDYSASISKRITEIGCRQVIIVGHSLGGLVSMDCATNPKFFRDFRVKGVITLGAPMWGTKMVPFTFGECSGQMAYQSPYIQGLQKRIAATTRTLFFPFGSKTDLLIRPTNSAYLQHPNAFNYEFESCGHISFLFSNSVAKKVGLCCRQALGFPMSSLLNID